jgi:hypothetical protein
VTERTRLLKRLAGCFVDHRDPELIEHSVASFVKQRVYGIALGYEDLNDHDTLRYDAIGMRGSQSSTKVFDLIPLILTFFRREKGFPDSSKSV